MSTTVKGVIARGKGAEVELVDVVVPDPGANDVVVRVQSCGVCHTDLAYRDGGISDDYPFLLGHEAAGVVETVGEDVTHVAEGDFVVLNWRAVCGECRACKKGEPKYCFDTFNASRKMTLADGTELEPALGIGAFAEKTLVYEGQCTKVNPQADPSAVGLLGCGVMAGLGAAVNTGEIKRGETVAVIGAGGVGMAAIAGAKLAGATTIIAVDLSEAKLERALTFGATHTVNPSDLSGEGTGEDQPVVQAVQEILGGVGADVVVDAVGLPATFTQAFYMRDLAGRVVLVGVPTPEMTLELPFLDVFARGGAVKSSWYGDCLPERDFPMYTELYLQDRFPLGDFVDDRVGINDVEAAFEKMKQGSVLRSVVEL
ncbi:MAG: S-(hydroxymethyl)mycothiol dehydrogenase [Corynebacterium sp.]|uniref:S-(hydroxymethyl)mycothiol dehydrogenase n=1 Tax=unclassified Corynebacterium TaxID=2624378 RepID=UPI0026490B2F|nr:S-(hydroxymethyl)mycothiol dehydrogenase [Corynebacterium sp.]MDN5582218.1 S-(hydroxymethyl)mycothiol dehydrogenase [Corynebacterium sp.]MDN5720649.1 S-(hydroxymethyl)mycothiol dehydrogenase [Corynebacterium sp.]MDN6258514.1 S-(hydroxymethyl)mycothiol dehydrogenase [Corynebacterium sp.]MDN6325418.1 S-(hydroxymethyl)mycothiol dehydrogenase [Corynebacterium sp.]MDN6387200.1 S-(hydroxymethyl)mycothiol dehydrogenase [Corynebacterium sp.]